MTNASLPFHPISSSHFSNIHFPGQRIFKGCGLVAQHHLGGLRKAEKAGDRKYAQFPILPISSKLCIEGAYEAISIMLPLMLSVVDHEVLSKNGREIL
jgi:hypothetical protein